MAQKWAALWTARTYVPPDFDRPPAPPGQTLAGGAMEGADGKPVTETPTATLSKTYFRASGPTTIWPGLCAQRAAGGACLSRAAFSIVAPWRPRPPTAPTKGRRSSCAWEPFWRWSYYLSVLACVCPLTARSQSLACHPPAVSHWAVTDEVGCSVVEHSAALIYRTQQPIPEMTPLCSCNQSTP